MASLNNRLGEATAEVMAQRLTLERLLGARDRVVQQHYAAFENLTYWESEVEVLDLTQQLALALEGAWRKTFETTLAEVISEGLTLVFGEKMFLNIKSTTKAGASAVSFTLDTPTGETPIMNAEGGSVVQVVSFLLRLMVTLQHRPEIRKVLTLDEAFGGLSEENIPLLASLLRQLVDDTGIQLLFVTHNRQFGEVADRVFDVKKAKGEGVVTLLKTQNDEVA